MAGTGSACWELVAVSAVAASGSVFAGVEAKVGSMVAHGSVHSGARSTSERWSSSFIIWSTACVKASSKFMSSVEPELMVGASAEAVTWVASGTYGLGTGGCSNFGFGAK